MASLPSKIQKKSMTSENPENPWIDLLKDIWKNKGLVCGLVGLFFLFGVFFAMWTRPVYEANSLLQVKSGGSSLSAIVGGDMASLLGGGGSAETEIQLLQSRRVLETVVEANGFRNVAEPKGILKRILHREGRADISFLYFPDTSVMPVDRRNMPWRLVIDDSSRYSFYDDLGKKILSGVPGDTVRIPYQGDSVKISVSQLKGGTGQKFEVTQSSMRAAVGSFLGRLSVSEQGKRTGVLSVAFQDIYPDRAILAVDSVTSVYLRLNSDYSSSDAENTLKLLESQVPLAKQKLDSSLAAYNAYRQKVGSADIASETRIALETQTRLQQQILQLQQMRQEKARLFDDSHPAIVTLDEQIGILQKKLNEGTREMKNLPATQQDLVVMSSEIEFERNLYASLMTRLEQTRLLVEGSSESSRVIDTAEVEIKPVKPNKKMICLAFLFFGFCLALAVISVRKKAKGVTEPGDVSAMTGVSVYSRIAKGELAARDGIETLRISLELGFSKSGGTVLCVAGLARDVGASFVASELSKRFAGKGKNTLLIDADVLNGKLNQTFGVPLEPGLTDLLIGDVSVLDAIRKTAVPGLSVLSSGHRLTCPEGVFGSGRFVELLSQLRSDYDLVIVDTPPLLNAMDASVIGKDADEILLILESGRHPLQKIQECLRSLPEGKNRVIAFNKCVFADKSAKEKSRG